MATEELNFQEAWLKVRCFEGCSFRTEMVVQLPPSSFTVRLEVFSPENVPIRSVTGHLAESDLSSTGSCCSWPPHSSTSPDMCIKGEVGVQADPYLISLHGSTGDADPDNALIVGEPLAGEN